MNYRYLFQQIDLEFLLFSRMNMRSLCPSNQHKWCLSCFGGGSIDSKEHSLGHTGNMEEPRYAQRSVRCFSGNMLISAESTCRKAHTPIHKNRFINKHMGSLVPQDLVVRDGTILPITRVTILPTPFKENTPPL